jgi:hypothetical protein
MAMAAIQADRESAAVRARNICVLMWLSPNQGSICRMAGPPKFTNSRTPAGLISRNR